MALAPKAALKAATSVPAGVQAVASGVFAGAEPADGSSGLDAETLKRRGFSGKLGESLVLDSGSGALSVLVGLGERAKLDREALRKAGAAAARAASHCVSLAIELEGLCVGDVEFEPGASAVGEGALLALYRFDEFKSKASADELVEVTLVSSDAASLERAVKRASALAFSVGLARDLVNTPAKDLTPTHFAELARDLASEEGISIRVYEEGAIVAERLGGLLGVAAGSDEPPRLLRLEYRPRAGDAEATVALVGKGITFDSGGLSLKSAEGMMTMKDDMGGAAAVLATVVACARLDIGVNVLGYMPITENMPGGHAIKPGDVLKIRNGKTIEVLNTDAEGRLVLADALSIATEESPDAIIDLATLTGACVTALGRSIAGVMGNDDRLIDAVRIAGKGAGEALWPLPLPAGYRAQIDSDVADMKNIGATGQAGALAAALLLEEFVGDTPWAHLDIAGPAYTTEDKGYLKKGGTGFGVRTLVELLEHYEPLKGPSPTEAEGITVLR